VSFCSEKLRKYSEVDYSDCKHAVIDFPGKDEYEQRLLEVWNILYQSQADEGTL